LREGGGLRREGEGLLSEREGEDLLREGEGLLSDREGEGLLRDGHLPSSLEGPGREKESAMRQIDGSSVEKSPSLDASGSRRLQTAVFDVLSHGPDSVKTPDIGGSGSTRTFVEAVKERLQ
jgi:hypothetical protein